MIIRSFDNFLTNSSISIVAVVFVVFVVHVVHVHVGRVLGGVIQANTQEFDGVRVE